MEALVIGVIPVEQTGSIPVCTQLDMEVVLLVGYISSLIGILMAQMSPFPYMRGLILVMCQSFWEREWNSEL